MRSVYKKRRPGVSGYSGSPDEADLKGFFLNACKFILEDYAQSIGDPYHRFFTYLYLHILQA
jgi:hypothetical protein